MKNATSPARRLLLSKNFILMLVMLVVIILAISAWFTVNKTVTANNMTVKAVSTEIDIAPCIKTYDASYNVIKEGPGEFESSLEFPDFKLTKDCTGDGDNLIVPAFDITKDVEHTRKNTGREVKADVNGSKAVSNEYSRIQQLKNPTSDAEEYQYIEFEFYVRSKNASIQLGDDSQVLASIEPAGNLGTAPEVGDSKRSAYGPLNVDGLVGAVRVALIGEACSDVKQYWIPASGSAGKLNPEQPPESVRGTPVKQLLWVPRPDVKLNVSNEVGDVSNWTLETNVSSGDTYKHTYYKNNGSALEFVDPDNDSKTVVSSGTSNGIKSLGQSVDISDFTSYQTAPTMIPLVVDKNQYQTTMANYYVTKYTARVWIEGTDSEARRAMDGGSFKITLNFR